MIKVVHLHSCCFRVTLTEVDRVRLSFLRGKHDMTPDEILGLVIERGFIELTGEQPEKRS